jgi:hypothetical protein
MITSAAFVLMHQLSISRTALISSLVRDLL